MNIRLTNRSPDSLVVRLSLRRGARLFGWVFGLSLTLAGLGMLFCSLPHSDDLLVQRGASRVDFQRTQALAGGWQATYHTLSTDASVRAVVSRIEDGGNTLYRTLIESERGRLYYGKGTTSRAAVQAQVEQINAFLGNATLPTLELRESAWWWFLVPFGLVGVIAGVLTAGILNHTDTWTFDRARGGLVCQRRNLYWQTTACWPFARVSRVVAREHREANGSLSHQLLVELDGGETLEMSAPSRQVTDVTVLQDASDRINKFLRKPACPMRVEDEAGTASGTLMHADLAKLAETHPRTAHFLERVSACSGSTRQSAGGH